MATPSHNGGGCLLRASGTAVRSFLHQNHWDNLPVLMQHAINLLPGRPEN